MRNKRLIILLSVLGGIAAIIIIMSAIFTIYSTDAECQTPYGENAETYADIQSVNAQIRKVADDFLYKNIFLFNEQELLDRVNAEVPRANAHDVECIFPNKIVVRYYLVSETMQFKKGDRYVVTGELGKVMRVNAYDSVDPNGGHYNERMISVIPSSEASVNDTVGQTVCAEDSYDMTVLRTILDLSDRLIDTDTGNRAFDKTNYAMIDLSDRRNLTIRMRNGAANGTYGITFRLGDGTDMLAEKLRAMASWFTSSPQENVAGREATVSKYYSEAEGKWLIRVNVKNI